MGLCLGVKAFLIYTLGFPRCVGVEGVYRHQDSDSDSRGVVVVYRYDIAQ